MSFDEITEDQKLEAKQMKKIIKITSYGRYPMYVHAAYHRDGSIVRYFLLNWLHNAAPIDPENVKEVMKLAKAEALDRGLKDVHASTIDYKPKKMREVRIRGEEKSVRKVDTPCERKRYVVVDDGVIFKKGVRMTFSELHDILSEAEGEI